MKTCLIVEDNTGIRKIIADIIRDCGLDPIETASAAEAIGYCATVKPDVVLLDWDLPAMAALDFLGGVGALTADLRPDIVLCATENDAEQFKLAQAAGAQYHLLKPFDKKIIAGKLAEIGLIESDSGTESHVA